MDLSTMKNERLVLTKKKIKNKKKHTHLPYHHVTLLITCC